MISRSYDKQSIVMTTGVKILENIEVKQNDNGYNPFSIVWQLKLCAWVIYILIAT